MSDLPPPSLPTEPDPDAVDAPASGYRAGFVALALPTAFCAWALMRMARATR